MRRTLFLALALGLGPLAEAGAGPLSYLVETRRAQAALHQGDWASAEAAARRAEILSPQEHLAYPLRALALSMLDRDGEAIAEVRTAIRMHPKAVGLHGVLAFTLNRARLFKRAEDAAGVTIDKLPGSAWAWYQLAYAQAGDGDVDGSMRSLDQAAALESVRFGHRRARAAFVKGRKRLLALFEADPGLDACPYALRPIRIWSQGLPLSWLGLGAFLLAASLVGRRRLGRLLTRWVLARAGSPPPGGIVGLPGKGPNAADSPVESPTLPTGYRIVRQIGTGGMGAVFEAEDLALERRVAIKRMQDDIRDDPKGRERFLKEARTVAKLRHPGIVEIHAIVEHEGEVFLVFEFLEGRPLDAVLADSKRLGAEEALRLAAGICPALSYAHGHGVIHRDLKPANIMLLDDGRVKVMDFGIAGKSFEARTLRSLAEAAIGTPAYSAPESARGVVHPESDLYSLAVVLYQVLTGHKPFSGLGQALLNDKDKMRFDPPSVKVPGLPPGLDGFFVSALNSNPGKRPSSGADFQAEFERALGRR